MKTLDLSGRTALVTGGNRGIGSAAVLALAKAGASVTYTARSEASAAEGPTGAGITAKIADVAERGRMAEVMRMGFDILVNNAGIITPIGRMDEVDAEEWGRNIEVNLIAAFQVTQLAIRHMAGQGRGTIINLSSGAAHRAMEGWSAYCAGKAGLAMLTKCVHEEFGATGIRVFGFAPGVVDTGMQGSIRASGINPVSQLPRSSLAPPSEPAYAIAWLCTAEADAMAGREVDVRHADFRAACGLPVMA